jgi:tRNA_anti-like
VRPGRFIAILFAGALVFNWVWLGLSRSKAARDDANAVSVTAVQLFADYQADASKADATYKGAAVRVTGNVDRIGNDPDQDPYVTLMTNSATRRVQAIFPESTREQLAHLYRRQWVTVRCEGAGQQTDVVLSRCRLETNP